MSIKCQKFSVFMQINYGSILQFKFIYKIVLTSRSLKHYRVFVIIPEIAIMHITEIELKY